MVGRLYKICYKKEVNMLEIFALVFLTNSANPVNNPLAG